MLKFDERGLIPAICQDHLSGQVRMMAYMNQESLEHTLASGKATFFSRSRGALWTKGETSGNRLAVVRMLVDCDDDTVVLLVNREGDGNVCHTGERSCFYREVPLEASAQSKGGAA